MTQPIRLVINHAGAREILRSREVADELARRAAAIADAASGNVLSNGGEPIYAVHRDIGAQRAQISVMTVNKPAIIGEASHHWLLGALDAGR